MASGAGQPAASLRYRGAVAPDRWRRRGRGRGKAASSSRLDEGMSEVLLDAAGLVGRRRRRRVSCRPCARATRAPDPADPPRLTRSSRSCGRPGRRRTATAVRTYRRAMAEPGLRICEGLALSEAHPDRRRGALIVRHGKGAIASVPLQGIDTAAIIDTARLATGADVSPRFGSEGITGATFRACGSAVRCRRSRRQDRWRRVGSGARL